MGAPFCKPPSFKGALTPNGHTQYPKPPSSKDPSPGSAKWGSTTACLLFSVERDVRRVEEEEPSGMKEPQKRMSCAHRRSQAARTWGYICPGTGECYGLALAGSSLLSRGVEGRWSWGGPTLLPFHAANRPADPVANDPGWEASATFASKVYPRNPQG